MISCRLINSACVLLYSGEYMRFCAVRNVGQAQRDYLKKLLEKTPQQSTEGGTALQAFHAMRISPQGYL